jgi:ATP-dependent RNA helicase DDX35
VINERVPVMIFFLIHFPSPVPDYIKATVDTVVKIHQTEGDGDILAFLTGQVTPPSPSAQTC